MSFWLGNWRLLVLQVLASVHASPQRAGWGGGVCLGMIYLLHQRCPPGVTTVLTGSEKQFRRGPTETLRVCRDKCSL